VAQMQNQDPLSPMDNAQVTGQMAQIQSVTGIENLNKTVQGLSGQFMQMQALQGAQLIGREVIVPGNKITLENGVGEGGFELTSAADSVKVEVLGPSGHVLDTLNLGAQTAGAHNFSWNAGNNATATGVTFRVTAMSGSTKLDSTPLMHDTVSAINTSGDSLTLELKNSGNVAYSQVKAFN
jgi:flagellar basal-body rod modification protein FlgD